MQLFIDLLADSPYTKDRICSDRFWKGNFLEPTIRLLERGISE